MFAQPLPAGPLSEPANHDAVCAVLRWAARKGVDVADAGMVCDALGLNLKAALNKTEDEMRGTPAP